MVVVAWMEVILQAHPCRLLRHERPFRGGGKDLGDLNCLHSAKDARPSIRIQIKSVFTRHKIQRGPNPNSDIQLLQLP